MLHSQKYDGPESPALSEVVYTIQGLITTITTAAARLIARSKHGLDVRR